jgi:hypothetical protein
VALVWSAGVLADPTNVPMEQAGKRLDRNIARNPDNQGLRNASQRLIDNQVRQSTRGRNRAPGQQRLEVSRVERTERAERVERVERPERVERVERPERVERAARPERVERPERPGKR